MTAIEPGLRPANPNFSSGPCAKRPGWTLRSSSRRGARPLASRQGRQDQAEACDRPDARDSRSARRLQDRHRPGSDTGAVEMALWSLLGARGVDVLAWESFGEGWVTDVVKQLKLEGRPHPEGAATAILPDLASVDFDNDVVFTWNGTTSGVRVPNGDWIAADRKGLTICDATSAAFAQKLDWPKLDVVDLLLAEGARRRSRAWHDHLGPRAVERLESYTPAWPLPKMFRMTKGGKLIEGIFEGETINTPSMLCVEDYLDALQWAKALGGAQGAVRPRRRQRQRRSRDGSNGPRGSISSPRFRRPAPTPASASRSSTRRSPRCRADAQAAFAKALASLLEKEKVAYDIGAYRDAPPGLRIWCGATVETADVAGADGLARLCLWQGEGQTRQGGVEKLLLIAPSLRGAQRRSNPEFHSELDCFASLAMTADDSATAPAQSTFGRSTLMAPRVLISEPCHPPPSQSSRSAASKSISSRTSARTRKNSPQSSAIMTGSPSVRRPRSRPRCSNRPPI